MCMTKTVEIFDRGTLYEIVSQDHDETFECSSFEIDVGDNTILTEDGRTTIDIENDEFFHINEGDICTTVSVEDEEQQYMPETVTIPFEDVYTFSGKVEHRDIPNTETAYKMFKYLPRVNLEVSTSGDELTPVTIEFDGETYICNKVINDE